MRPRAQVTMFAFILLTAGTVGGCDDCSSNKQQTEQVESESSPPAAATRSPKRRTLTEDTTSDENTPPDSPPETSDHADATPSDDSDVEESASESEADEPPLFTASVSKDAVTIDLHGVYPGAEGRQVEFDRRHGGQVEYRRGDVRPPYDKFHRFDVLTKNGVVTLEMTHIGQYTCGGEGMKTCYELVADSPAESFDSDRYTTLVGPEHSFPDDATIRSAEVDEPNNSLRNAFTSSLLDRVSPGERALLEDNRLKPLREASPDARYLDDWKTGHGTIQDSTFGLIRGDFLDPHAHLLTMTGPEGTNMLGLKFPMYRAVALVSDAGEITHLVKCSYGPRLALGHVDRAGIEIQGLADTDPETDALDGVLMSYDGHHIWVDIAAGQVTTDQLKH